MKMTCPVCGSTKAVRQQANESVRIFKRPKFRYRIELCRCRSCGDTAVLDDTETGRAIAEAEYDFVSAFLKGLMKDFGHWPKWKADPATMSWTGLENLLKIPYGTIARYFKAGKFSPEFVTMMKMAALLIISGKFNIMSLWNKTMNFEHRKGVSPIVWKKRRANASVPG